MRHLIPISLLLLLCGTPTFSTAADQSITILSQNARRLFDHIDDGQKEQVTKEKTYRLQLAKLAAHLKSSHPSPALIALQEVENLRVLQHLASHLSNTRHSYREILIEGNDVSGIDVGFLLRDDIRLERAAALFAEQQLADHQGKLFARPPLLLEICRNQCLTVVNLHLRSMRGLKQSRKASWVARKRQQQALTLAQWIGNWQRKNAQQPLLLIGDFNALAQSDRHVDVVGTLLGRPDRSRPRLKTADLISPDLIDISLRIPIARRYSYRYRGKAQQLDYALANKPLDKMVGSIRFGAIDYQVSDHAPLILSLDLE